MRFWNDFLAALRFFTRLPVPASAPVSVEGGGGVESPLARAAWAFPAAGVIVGGLGGAALWLAAAVFGLPPLAAGLIGVGVLALVTGALHEDGLADVADAFGAARDKAARLAVMRDSRIGAFGALALIVFIGLRVSALAAFTSPALAALSLAAACAASRAVLPCVMAALPPAREDGLGARAGRPAWTGCAAALALAAAVTLVFAGPGATVVTMTAAGAGAGAAALLAWRLIGGQTGDTLGAAEQAAQTCALFALMNVFA
ncbi:MAG: adenosylcobinamide-GDP ribazoletransferase [Rhodospirillales bacterium]